MLSNIIKAKREDPDRDSSEAVLSGSSLFF